MKRLSTELYSLREECYLHSSDSNWLLISARPLASVDDVL